MTALTQEQFQVALPAKLRGSVSQEIYDRVNALCADPNLGEQYRDNLVGYTSVINEGRFKLESYVDAVKFVTQKMTGKTDVDAYIATFPDKYQDFCARNVAQKDIASYISAYKKGKLVTLIMEQGMIPLWLGNQDMAQRALQIQFDLAQNASSEKVRCDAANSILTHLKQPEKTKVTLDLSENMSDTMKAVRDQTLALVEQQRAMISQGFANAKDIAAERLPFEIDV